MIYKLVSLSMTANGP